MDFHRANQKVKMIILERFQDKYIPDPNSGCWLWTAYCDPKGYGRFRLRGRIVGAHRASYEIFVGPIPDGLYIDHLCRVRSCVNPAHMELVTNQENIRRGEAGKATGIRQRAKTHCPSGHPYNEENTYQHTRSRQCRECKKIYSLKRRKKHDQPPNQS